MDAKVLSIREANAKLIKLKYESGRESRGNTMYADALYKQAQASKMKSDRALESARRDLLVSMRVVLGKKYVDNIWAEVSDYKQMDGVQDNILSMFRKRHNTPADKDDSVRIMNMAEFQAMLSGTIKTFSMLLGIIAGISLVVGGIGIMNIMLVSVSERTKEIGLRKAIGATRRAVLLQFLIEAVIVSILGGLIGIIVGSASALLLAKFSGWAVFISPVSVGLAFGFSAGVGIIFGFWPAKKASELSPIEALRYE